MLFVRDALVGNAVALCHDRAASFIFIKVPTQFIRMHRREEFL